MNIKNTDVITKFENEGQKITVQWLISKHSSSDTPSIRSYEQSIDRLMKKYRNLFKSRASKPEPLSTFLDQLYVFPVKSATSSRTVNPLVCSKSCTLAAANAELTEEVKDLQQSLDQSTAELSQSHRTYQ